MYINNVIFCTSKKALNLNRWSDTVHILPIIFTLTVNYVGNFHCVSRNRARFVLPLSNWLLIQTVVLKCKRVLYLDYILLTVVQIEGVWSIHVELAKSKYLIHKVNILKSKQRSKGKSGSLTKRSYCYYLIEVNERDKHRTDYTVAIAA